MPTLDNSVHLEPLGQPVLVFRVASGSRVGLYHYVMVFEDEHGIICTCEAAQYGKTCKHVAAIPLCTQKYTFHHRDAQTQRITPSTIQCDRVLGHRSTHRTTLADGQLWTWIKP